MQITRFDMTGASEFETALKSLGTSVATKIGVQAVRASGEALQEAWQHAAPYDPQRRGDRQYGHLRENIKVQRRGTANPNVIAFRVTTGDAFWAYFYEFGTAKQPARPIFRGAVESMRDTLISIQTGTLRKGIEAAMSNRGKA